MASAAKGFGGTAQISPPSDDVAGTSVRIRKRVRTGRSWRTSLAVAGIGLALLPGLVSATVDSASATSGGASSGGLSGYKVKLTGWPSDAAGTSVAVGDVNGDGIADYLIGDPTASPNGRAQSGSVYVIYGRSSDKTRRGRWI